MNAKQNPLFTFIAERYQQPEFQPSMLSGYRTKLPVFPPDTILTPLDPTASPIQIRSLLEQSPVVIVALRRPGCFMCRYSALLMQRHIQKINDLGGRLIAVCKEDVGLPEFVDKVWKQELYIDFDMQVYRYLWDGELVKTSMAFNAINPRFWNNVKEAQTMYPDSNFEGEGHILGGVAVLSKHGEVLYKFKEEIPGDTPPIQDIFDALISQLQPEQTQQYFLVSNDGFRQI